MVKISPSLISADHAELGKTAKALESAGADYLHIDVMDGKFVPNITIGSQVIKDLKKHTKLKMDVHLMVENPSTYIKAFADAGSDIITIHIEAEMHVCRTLKAIRSMGKKSGIAILPTTTPDCLHYIMEYLDLILVMLVDPGFSGQKTLEEQISKISDIKKIIGDRPIEISADGGINPLNSQKIIQAGAEVLVAGNAVFHNKNYRENIRNILRAIEE